MNFILTPRFLSCPFVIVVAAAAAADITAAW